MAGHLPPASVTAAPLCADLLRMETLVTASDLGWIRSQPFQHGGH